jgi:hypothetical protein
VLDVVERDRKNLALVLLLGKELLVLAGKKQDQAVRVEEGGQQLVGLEEVDAVDSEAQEILEDVVVQFTESRVALCRVRR